MVDNFSKQERFDEEEKRVRFWSSTSRFIEPLWEEQPPYDADTRKLDDWVSRIYTRDYYLSGIVAQMVSIYKNRGWIMTGGKNVVKRYKTILHESEDGKGWRWLKAQQSLSYLTSNFGGPIEVGRYPAPYFDNASGGWVVTPMKGLYTMDPTLARLTGKRSQPLDYDGIEFGPYDYYKVTAMPSNRKGYFGVGLSPVFRCIEVAKLMIALHEYEVSRLDPSRLDGLVLLEGITMEQFEDALRSRRAENNRSGTDHLAILASMDTTLEAKLVSLAQLSETFNDFDSRVRWILTAYAMNFGMQLEEFLGSHANTILGQSGAEVEAGMTRASSKGIGDFMIDDQEQIQKLMPETLEFAYRDRDSGAEMADLQIKEIRADIYTKMFLAVRPDGTMLGTVDDYLRSMARDGTIDADWTAEEETVTVDDSESINMDRFSRSQRRNILDKAMSSSRTRRAIELCPDEPIVQYEWWVDGDEPKEVELVLWNSGDEAMRRRVWHFSQALSNGLYEPEQNFE